MHPVVFRAVAAVVIAPVPSITTQVLIGNADPDCSEVTQPRAAAPALAVEAGRDVEQTCR